MKPAELVDVLFPVGSGHDTDMRVDVPASQGQEDVCSVVVGGYDQPLGLVNGRLLDCCALRTSPLASGP